MSLKHEGYMTQVVLLSVILVVAITMLGMAIATFVKVDRLDGSITVETNEGEVIGDLMGECMRHGEGNSRNDGRTEEIAMTATATYCVYALTGQILDVDPIDGVGGRP